MSLSNLPDKWVRKALGTILDGLVVSGKTFKCFDTNTLNYIGDTYFILSTQTNTEVKNKCRSGWRSTVLIEVFTRYKKNVGSRVLAEDAIQMVLDGTEDLALDVASNLTINSKSVSTPNDITDKRGAEVIHRKFIRYELFIN